MLVTLGLKRLNRCRFDASDSIVGCVGCLVSSDRIFRFCISLPSGIYYVCTEPRIRCVNSWRFLLRLGYEAWFAHVTHIP